MTQENTSKRISEIDEIDKLLSDLSCSNIQLHPGKYDERYAEVDPVSIKYVKQQLLALKSKWEAEARLDEWDYAYECMRAANDTASLYLSKERDIRFAELNQLTNGDKLNDQL